MSPDIHLVLTFAAVPTAVGQRVPAPNPRAGTLATSRYVVYGVVQCPVCSPRFRTTQSVSSSGRLRQSGSLRVSPLHWILPLFYGTQACR